MQSHLGSVVLCLASTLCGWVKSSSKLLSELWWKCTTTAECKTDISAVLTVKRGLDPHMINWIKDWVKLFSGYFLWPCWVPTISVPTLAYCCSEGESCGEVFWRWCWVLGMRNPQLIVCEVWSLRFQDRLYNSDNLLFVVILFYVILLLIIHLWCLYMYETWSWHTYSYAFGFVLKTGCDNYQHIINGGFHETNMM